MFLFRLINKTNIDYLGQSLAANTELEVLNLADNKISSFQVRITLKKMKFKYSLKMKLFIEGYYYINGITQIAQYCF
jgi:Leucine-rich repeat (LRR) protein